MNGTWPMPSNGDLDKWTYRAKIWSQIVSNVGFPILVSAGLILVIWRALPTMEKLDMTMQTVSETLKSSVNEQRVRDDEMLLIIKTHDMKEDQNGKAIEELERKEDQYHQDFMLSHRYPLPSDPLLPRHR